MNPGVFTRNIFAALLVLLSLQVFSQPGSDHAKREKKLDALAQKGVVTVFVNPDSALLISKQLFSIHNIDLYPRVLSKAYKIKGIYHLQAGNFGKALELFYSQKLYAEKAGDTNAVISSYNNIGLMYINMGSYERALKTLFKGKAIIDATNLRSSENSIINNIALAHEKLGNDSLALRYYLKNENKKDSLIDPPGFSTTLNNIGWQYVKLKQYKLAQTYLTRAYKLASACNDYYIVELSQINLAELNVRLKNFDKAYELQTAASEMAKKNKDYDLYATAIFNTGDLLFNSLKKPVKGINLTEEAFDSVTAAKNLPLMRDFSGQLASFYERIGKMDKSVEYYKIYIRYKDSLNKQSSILAITEMQVMHDVENKQRSIEALSKKNEEQEQKARILQWTVIVGLMVTAVIIFLILSRYRLKQKANQKLSAAYKSVDEKNKEISDSINYAKRIQEAIMPSHSALLNGLKNGFVIFKPKDVVSGDFYWMETLESKVLFAAADCTGHGVPGAMVSVVCANALSKSLLEEGINEPGKLLDRTRELVIQSLAKSGEEMKDGMDISLCSLDTNKKTLQWSGANNPLWHIRDGVLTEYKPNKQPIGFYAGAVPFTTHSINLQTNDTIYVFTDGYQDQFGGEKGKKFKASTLKELLVSIQPLNMDQQKEKILHVFEHWKGGLGQVDDICMIGVRV